MELLGPLKLLSNVLDVPMQLQRIDAGRITTYTRFAHSEFESTAGDAARREPAVDTYVVAMEQPTDSMPSSLDAAYQWTSVAGWMRGLGLDDAPGHMLWVVHGRKFRRAEELPAVASSVKALKVGVATLRRRNGILEAPSDFLTLTCPAMPGDISKVLVFKS